MTSSCNDTVKEGAVKMKSKKTRQWKKAYIVLKKPSSRGRLRIEKYDDEKSFVMSSMECKVIDLCNIKSIDHLSPDVKRACISIVFFNGTSQQFTCETDEEAKMWHMALTDVFDKYGAKAGASDCFNVYLLSNPAMAFCGECLMLIETDRILLKTVEDDSKPIEWWQFGVLRKFTGDSEKFLFESGRRSRTGEGLFIFNTKEGVLIQETMQSAIRVLQEHDRIMRSMRGPSSPPAAGLLGHSTSVTGPPTNQLRSWSLSESAGGDSSFSSVSSSPPGSVSSLTGRRASDGPTVSRRDDWNRSMSFDANYVSTNIRDRAPLPTPRTDLHNGRLVHYEEQPE